MAKGRFGESGFPGLLRFLKSSSFKIVMGHGGVLSGDTRKANFPGPRELATYVEKGRFGRSSFQVSLLFAKISISNLTWGHHLPFLGFHGPRWMRET